MKFNPNNGNYKQYLDVANSIALFWNFILNPNFRETKLSEFRDAGFFNKAFSLFEAFVSIILGLLLPIGIIFLIFKWLIN